MSDSTQYFKPGVPLRPQRVALQVPVRYRVLGEQAWHVGKTENISRTGVLIRGVRVMALTTGVEVILTVPTGIIQDLAGEVICAGVVARLVASLTGGSPGMGVTFANCRPASVRTSGGG